MHDSAYPGCVPPFRLNIFCKGNLEMAGWRGHIEDLGITWDSVNLLF